jgi:urease accessory protein UreE
MVDLRGWPAVSAASSERLVVRDRAIQVDTAAGFPLPGRSRTARDRTISRAVNRVAHHLGNTPAVCRKSCIDPPLLDRGAGCTQPGPRWLSLIRSAGP